MEVTKSYSSIEKILELYPRNINKVKYEEVLPSITQNSPNLEWKGWEQSYKAAKSTLEYIDRLKSKVYILIIENNKMKDFIKFAPKGSPKELRKYLNKLDPKLQWSRKDLISLKKTDWKFMSCILQDRNDDDTEDRHMYHSIMEKITAKYEMSNGMYIFSMRDALLVHKKRIHPWIDVIGGELHMKSFPPKLLPIFNTTGGKHYWDIPIPNFEDKRFIYNNKPSLEDINLDWNSKKPTAVFRGGASGCGYDARTNQRIKLAVINETLEEPNTPEELKTMLDAGITAASRKFRFAKNTGLGYFDFKKSGLPEATRLSKIDQSNFKYIIYTEGNVSAHRLAVDMLLGSVILFVETEYTLWFEHLLKEYVHFIPVKADLSNLLDQIQLCRDNDELCKQIAENARSFALELLTKEVFENTITNYVRHF